MPAATRATKTVLREPVYMVDFAVFKPDDELKINLEGCAESAWSWKHPDGESVSRETHEFVKKVFEKSGIDNNGSYLPKNLHPQHTDSPVGGQDESFAEARLVMGGAVEEVLRKTGIAANEIDILVTTSSVFAPTPSVASMLINMFKMREDVQAYSLAGMGCGNGVIGIQLVRDVLQAHPGANALFICSEICSSAFYRGRDKHCLVSNALFRMGGCAAVLTSGASQKISSKYVLTHSERVHTGARDTGYNCMYVGPDDEGLQGIFLYKDLPIEAGLALEKCLKKITPQIMTWGQYAEAAVAISKRRWFGKDKVPLYVPDYTRCVDHFCLHAGGYAILKGIQKGMKLPADKMMPSFANLKDYGNTSSSTTWYSWAYIETVGDVKKNQTIMQAGVGGGMKAGINIWRALKDITDVHPAWAQVANKRYTEADLPRPITRKEDVGTLTGTKEFDDTQGQVKKTNWGAAGDAATTAQTLPTTAADVQPATDVSHKQSDVTAVISSSVTNGKAATVQPACRRDVDSCDQHMTDGESLAMSDSAVAV
jgi:3-ketoacyl-CoA synthase